MNPLGTGSGRPNLMDVLLRWGVSITMVKGDQVAAVLNAGEVGIPHVHRTIIRLLFCSR